MAMHREATEAVDELRDLAQGVYPARLHEIGLARALHAVARRSPVPIEIDDATSEEIDESTQVALYYVCVEAIQNATKHGSPDTTIEVSLSSNGDGLVVTVADDGPGFDPSEHEDSRGLLNMADRVGALGGDLSIDSSPGSGTTVTRSEFGVSSKLAKKSYAVTPPSVRRPVTDPPDTRSVKSVTL